ncbi:DHHC zinc finger domain-containing protein [Besnoitia besnoiti]|uniref:protein S-acyltransferase n=1 Tax=Besnoitia besnoiti TaxID=94643 RepID=A0A2A9MAK1_BESBE|nr:DHHC zinc finger domain-containing protein [Besnoitia besnoiti]PFH32390.1 DHHC zinc finger domain-containing protein [Besnoitia besnoiti]
MASAASQPFLQSVSVHSSFDSAGSAAAPYAAHYAPLDATPRASALPAGSVVGAYTVPAVAVNWNPVVLSPVSAAGENGCPSAMAMSHGAAEPGLPSNALYPSSVSMTSLRESRSIGAFEPLFIEAARRKQSDHFMVLVRQLVVASGAQTDAGAVGALRELCVLHHACALGDVALIKQLVSRYNLDPESRHPQNLETPVFFAIRNAHFDVVRFLVKLAGPSCLTAQTRGCMTPFLAAAAAKHDERPRDLLKILEFIYLHGASLEEQNASGDTALFLAAKHGNLHAVQWLVARGASMNHRDHTGGTVLHAAVAKTGGFAAEDDPLQFLCENGAVKLIDTRADIGLQFETMRERPWAVTPKRFPGLTVLQRCLMKRQWFSYLMLLTWRLQYQIFGYTRMMKSSYAYLYWAVTLFNVPLFLNAVSQLHAVGAASVWELGMLWILLWGLTQFFWFITCSSDPGIAQGSQHTLKPQYDSIYPTMNPEILDRIPPPSSASAIGPSHYRMLQMEREQMRLNLELQEVRRTTLPYQSQDLQAHADRAAAVREEDTRVLVTALKALRADVVALMPGVAAERRSRLAQEYVEAVLEGPAAMKTVCVTCELVRTARIHHCADCGHCLERQDHHCVWVDTCVARNNVRPFWFFLLSVTALLIWNDYVSLLYLKNLCFHLDQLVRLTCLGAGVMNFMALVFVSYLLVRTTRVMITNVTYYEFLKKPVHIQSRFKGRTAGWLWDFRGLTPAAMIRNIALFWQNADALDDLYLRPEATANFPESSPFLAARPEGPYLPLSAVPSPATAAPDGALEPCLVKEMQGASMLQHSTSLSFASEANVPPSLSSAPSSPMALSIGTAPPSRVPSAVLYADGPSPVATSNGYKLLPTQPLYMTSDASTTASQHPSAYAPSLQYPSPVSSTKAPPSPAGLSGCRLVRSGEAHPQLRTMAGTAEVFADQADRSAQQPFFSHPLAVTQPMYVQCADPRSVV